MRTRSIIVGVVTLEAALAGYYTFTKMADTSGPFARFDFGGAPAINDKGTIDGRAGNRRALCDQCCICALPSPPGRYFWA